ncbi:YidH family protein [Kitasatospora sp. NPDC050543]|uniref:YidH family protein n=1 Tax=Kitasatospora sp. NPDC050543 TaxID=3364054 RepID=UPI00379072FB
MPEPAWRREDEEPDYRFSLANERTFLAWVRTALGLLAGGVAIDQLATDLAPAALRTALAAVCALGGAVLAALAYRRWSAVERAMRAGNPLPHTPVLIMLAVGVALIAAVFCVLIVRNA